MTAPGPPAPESPGPRSRLRDYTVGAPQPQLKTLTASHRHPMGAPAAFATPIASDPRRLTAGIVVGLITGTTALAMYDLYLFFTLVAH